MSKILIVEDEISLANALKDKLEREGYETVIAVNGQEGIDKAVKTHPDAILLDIIMPVKDGITMLKEMKTIESIKDIPVVLLTNLSDSNTTMQAISNGVHDYLIKSDWKIDDVVKVIAEKVAKGV